tara:strand:+ start:6783 stop:6989 length:207 start_codon:yes stop_codon:yes gene_type:complete
MRAPLKYRLIKHRGQQCDLAVTKAGDPLAGSARHSARKRFRLYNMEQRGLTDTKGAKVDKPEAGRVAE